MLAVMKNLMEERKGVEDAVGQWTVHGSAQYMYYIGSNVLHSTMCTLQSTHHATKYSPLFLAPAGLFHHFVPGLCHCCELFLPGWEKLG